MSNVAAIAVNANCRLYLTKIRNIGDVGESHLHVDMTMLLFDGDIATAGRTYYDVFTYEVP